MREYLVISTSVDLVRVASEDIVYVSSDGNYSSFVFSYGEPRVVTMQLGQVERLLSEQLRGAGGDFIRIGKSLIVNRNYINYINVPRQQLVVGDGRGRTHGLTASKEALRQLKGLIEREMR